MRSVFGDNTSDSNLYNQNFDAICEAIAESASGAEVPDETEPPEPVDPEEPDQPTPPGAELVVEVNITAPPGVIVNVTQSVSGKEGLTVLSKNEDESEE